MLFYWRVNAKITDMKSDSIIDVFASCAHCEHKLHWSQISLDDDAEELQIRQGHSSASDVDTLKKSILIRYDIFENLYRYIDIISRF